MERENVEKYLKENLKGIRVEPKKNNDCWIRDFRTCRIS